jgi:hypothetical protein
MREAADDEAAARQTDRPSRATRAIAAYQVCSPRSACCGDLSHLTKVRASAMRRASATIRGTSSPVIAAAQSAV